MEMGVSMASQVLHQPLAPIAQASQQLLSKRINDVDGHYFLVKPLVKKISTAALCDMAGKHLQHCCAGAAGSNTPALELMSQCKAKAAVCIMCPVGWHRKSWRTETGAQKHTFICSTWYFGSILSERHS